MLTRAPLSLSLCALLSGCVLSGKLTDTSLLDTSLHECDPRPATTLSGEVVGTLAHAESLSDTFTSPADLRTGVLTLTLASPRDDDDKLDMGVSLLHPDIGIDDLELDKAPGAGVAVAAAVSPGEAVEMRVSEWGYQEGAPDTYEARGTWEWVESADCYEPNDTPQEAKHVPTGVDLQAWMLSGLGPNPDLDDWYRFTLAEPSTVTLTMTFAATIPMGFTLYEGDSTDAREVFSSLYNEEPGAYTWASDTALDAGTYTVRFTPFVSLAEVDTPLAPQQPHLYEGYTFRFDASPRAATSTE